jgi:hypothetical protein
VGASTSHIPMGLHGLLQGQLFSVGDTESWMSITTSWIIFGTNESHSLSYTAVIDLRHAIKSSRAIVRVKLSSSVSVSIIKGWCDKCRGHTCYSHSYPYEYKVRLRHSYHVTHWTWKRTQPPKRWILTPYWQGWFHEIISLPIVASNHI